ncbi:uncharacterized protein LOC62_06G007938 [Vanrija pseudolonga]|uniref:Uncharacterized protein n=1 Tax=Vanrija pseudolonga TaxID=143232 RepID=A0AAF1BPT3_9TREE|nr:hypothetical protein LOC62_06G007938 [Vanrija pseudolonga]
MLALNALALSLITTASALNWGDRCGWASQAVCENTGTCDNVGGTSWAGDCPGLPDNVRCCAKQGCMHPDACPIGVRYGECPGGSNNVMCPGYASWCGNPGDCTEWGGNEATVLSGFCPGGEDNKLCRYKVV